MADPYATDTPDLSGRPAGPPPWHDEVTARGGAIIGPDGVPGGTSGTSPDFLVIACRGIGTLAPFAMVEAAMAVLLWLEHAAAPRDGAVANRLLATLADFEGPIHAIKQGSVGGPAGSPGCAAVTPELVATLLGARERIDWEPDPDFAYGVVAAVPGLADPDARILLPRLLYADNDRVYEHAGLVADKKQERHDLAAAVAGLDPAVVAIAGWPPFPSTDHWRD